MQEILNTLFPTFSKELNNDIETSAKIHTFKAGEVIMRTGQYINHTMLLTKGQIKIYREGENGGEFFMYYIQPGQACAVSMICATKSQVSRIMAKAVDDVEIIIVPLPLMEKWMMEHRTWNEFVLLTYRIRFEEILEVVDNIAFRAMDERLEFYLKRHADACGCCDLKFSHQDIATELNTSREVISRLLKKMEQRGMVVLHRNHIELLK
ncbi:MAG: Crp/Fnr family transcriptional regulator [Flavobacteriaceae bacterium]|jgi:CRP/FNR family transcriptional regulator|uniref:Crp/Fnr family transcriptional regulator n=1 Tax=Flavobacterium kayseriense TaxID=2764714 RepID=A0ABR7J9E0_9FLAO|nr:Crp/Fnr family transcriptional regulator [Flavobacterium kayseriense]MBC5842148.1 Crp/Fnr family transcriptional regulator [Flavobacterium kayseriense]MBC5848678.1 Crp/Fnr family transcriptional regulator [Flavobacterium kayseriense]MBU0941353.1 Crp/Fnr family transcriptional regulator [Bacteroidota bacterium]MBX9889227.1 Crp/Fnr family transcriptional regulator [Flavobacteriaceae bacterium]